ncbi:MAG TPA: malectin domain-containing carbohydrate-binding protein [Blastocatellia bacterium]
MRSEFQTPDNVSMEDEKAELEAVLASSLFVRTPSLANLLSYLCQKYFQGEADRLKEYTIGVEAFGRAPDFDKKEDSIVRVEIRRLREKLRQYYETEGGDHSIRLTIPVGHYVPVFTKNGAAPFQTCTDSQEAAEAPDSPSARYEPGSRAALPALVESRRSRLTTFRILLGLGIGIALIFLTLAGKEALSSRGSAPYVSITPAVVTEPAANAPASAPNAAPTAESEIRILAGSNIARYQDHAGKIWSGDRYFTGGAPYRAEQQFIYRTLDSEIYRVSRQGDFTYDIPLKPGVYELRLHFAETFFGPEELVGGGETSRLMLVRANGNPLLHTYDIYSNAGGARTADVRVFKDIRPAEDGFLHLEFSSSSNAKALLNAIEVIPGVPGRIRPVRITPHNASVFTKEGQEWGPDCYFKGGQTIERVGAVTGTANPEIYRVERYGNFSYAIPVAPGRYTVTLRFAERYFGTANSLGGGPGSRIFHVFCNGEALLKNLDVFKEAGGADRALEKTFTGVAPNEQGYILLEFKPVVNYALIYAIEVIPEPKE